MTGWTQLWDLHTRREIARTKTNEATSFSMEFSSDGAWLAISTSDRIGRLYDISGTQFKLLEIFRDAGWISISPDKKRVMVDFETLRIYDPGVHVETPTAISGLERGVDWDVLAKKTTARVRSGDKIYDLDPLTGQSREEPSLSGRPIQIPLSGETWGLIQHDDGSPEIIDFDTRRTVFVLPKATKAAGGIAQFPDNRRAVVFSGDKSFEIWDTANARLIKQVNTAEYPYFGKASPDGRWLAMGYFGNAVSVWNTADWTEHTLRPQGGNGTLGILFSPDSARVLIGTFDNTAEIWDVRSGKLIGKLIGHSLAVEEASYSLDGKRIVTASDDGTVRIWDASTLRELTQLAGHNRPVIHARFTDDGRSIVSIDDKGNTKTWLTKTPPGLVAPATPASAP